MYQLEDYDFHVLWNKKKIELVLIGYTAGVALLGAFLIKSVFDASVPVATPKNTEFPHPNSPSFGR